MRFHLKPTTILANFEHGQKMSVGRPLWANCYPI